MSMLRMITFTARSSALRYLDARLATAQDFGIFTNPVKSRIHTAREVAGVRADLAGQVEALGLSPELLNFTVEPTSKFVCMQVPVGEPPHCRDGRYATGTPGGPRLSAGAVLCSETLPGLLSYELAPPRWPAWRGGGLGPHSMPPGLMTTIYYGTVSDPENDPR